MTLSRPLLAFLLLATPAAAAAQDDAFSLDGLIVTASPSPREASSVSAYVTLLEGDRLRADGVSTVAEALRAAPGLSVQRSGSFGSATSLFMRGGESDYVLVLVDGVQVNQPGGSYDFSALTLDNVERIEVLRGPASALYGSDAVAGVVHVITRTGSGPMRGTVSTTVGSFGRRDFGARVSGGTAASGYSVSLSRSQIDGILDFNNAHRNTVLSGSARFAPNRRTRADVSFRVGDREYRFPTDGSGNQVDRNALTFGDETLVSFRLVRALHPKLDLEARVGVADTDAGSNDAQDDAADTLGFFGFTSLDHVRRATADLRASWSAGSGVWTAGVEVEEERQRSFTESLSEYGTSTGRSEHERSNVAYYAHTTGSRGSLTFNAGVRVEDNQRFGTFQTWQLGATWSLPGMEGVRLRSLVGRGLKEPTFFENFATGFARGNPALEPERSLSWEFGADLEPGPGVQLRATWFDQSFRDLIQYTFAPPNPSDPNFYNVAAADSRGLEVEAAAERGGVRASASWTWLDTEVTDAGFDQGQGATFVNGEPLLRRPSHTLSAGVSARLAPALRLFSDLTTVGKRPDRDFSTFPATPVELPRHTLLALGAAWSPESGGVDFTLTLRAENLLDRQYEEIFGFRAPGRGIYIGGSVALGER